MRKNAMQRRDLLPFALMALLACSAPSPALAQGKYPSHSIRLVIPYPPGGVNDAVGRPWADRMKTLLGTVVVENIGGAGGSLGAAAVARAQPDGYTILIGNAGTQIVNPTASSRSIYDPRTSFESIAILGVSAIGIVIHPSIPATTLREFIAYAKANPGKLSYGSPGAGTMSHLSAELFKSLSGTTDILHVPYRGAGPATTDAIAGQVPMITPNVTGQTLELHRSGKLRLLAVTSPTRLSAAPDIPTAVEAGLPGMISQNFIGLFAPARTPREIIDQIAQATRTAMADRELQRIYIASGFEPMLDSSPEKARQFLEDAIARWTPVIKSVGLKLD